MSNYRVNLHTYFEEDGQRIEYQVLSGDKVVFSAEATSNATKDLFAAEFACTTHIERLESGWTPPRRVKNCKCGDRFEVPKRYTNECIDCGGYVGVL